MLAPLYVAVSAETALLLCARIRRPIEGERPGLDSITGIGALRTSSVQSCGLPSPVALAPHAPSRVERHTANRRRAGAVEFVMVWPCRRTDHPADVTGSRGHTAPRRGLPGSVTAVPSRSSKQRSPVRKRTRVGRPPGKTSAETRAAIVAAAREQFVRVGYERATNCEIAAEAGVTAAAIYQYFASKTELYVAVASETLDAMIPKLREATREAQTARAALAAVVRAQTGNEQQVSSARFLAGIAVEMQRHPEIAKAMVAQPGTFFELVLEIIGRGVKSGEIARDKAESVVGMYIAALIGLAIHGATVGGSHSQAATQGFIELLEGTLFR
jgi:TetR/AcrR family transcriptional regulator, mexJK operon transcriptional repressor